MRSGSPRARCRLGGRHEEEEGPVGQEPARGQEVELEHALDPEAAGQALVGERGVEVAVGDDVGAARERGPDHLVDELRPGGGEERRLGPGRQALPVEQDLADPLAGRVPPGSRVSTTSRPSDRSRSASSRACVDFPEPSTPSKVTNMRAP